MRVAHFSDLHVRNYSRHEEYKKALVNFYASLRGNKPDLIVFTGDLCHLKVKISPELVQFCSEFFVELSNIAPVHLILGNHDCTLNNLSRLDAITPIVEALNNSNIHFYKNSGIYPIPGFDKSNFVVFSCTDKEWPTSVPEGELNIGLYHGFVNGARLQNNMIVKDCPHKVEDFLKLTDYLMLGDIHRMQVMDLKHRVAYAGSLIQQNYGESVNKGYLLWKFEGKDQHDLEEVTLPNVCPFVTVKLGDDLKVPDIKIQPNSRVRVLSRQLSVLEKNMLRDRFTEKFEPHRLDWLDDVNPHRQELHIDHEDTKMENLDNLGIQEKLLTRFLEQYDLDQETLGKIFEINRRYNTHIRKEEDTLRNVLYRIGKVKFSDTFSFGKDNEIDFPKYRGLLGVFGKSGVGKSSAMVDVPLYCMFNKISKRVTKNDWIINENAEQCSVEMEIFLRDKMYKIDRVTSTFMKSGKKKGKPVYQGRTDVDFRSFDEDGNEVELNGTERADTDIEIRKLFGSAEDFTATSVAPQWKLLNIVEAGGTDRQKLIGRYFDIDIFNQKHALAKDELRDTSARLKIYGTRNIQEELEQWEEEFEKINQKVEDVLILKQLQKDHKGLIENHIQDARYTLVPVGGPVSEKEILQKIKARSKVADEFRPKAERLEEINIESVKKNLVDHEKVSFLKKQADSLQGSCSCDHEEGCLLAKEISKLRDEADKINKETTISQTTAKLLMKEYRKIEATTLGTDRTAAADVERYREILAEIRVNKEKIEKNLEIEKEIAGMVAELKEANEALDLTAEEALRLSKELGASQAAYDTTKASVDEYTTLRANYEAFDYFMRAMSKDGIVRQIIANNLGIINSEIEKILSHGVGFTVTLESNEDGKAIDIFFKHERSPKRHIELCSGMEKTLAEVSIRAALVNITTLPRSNIFVLDESFGALDPEYMAGLTRILEYLKTLFETVIIITHSDELRDFVDHVIEVERDEDGYARLT